MTRDTRSGEVDGEKTEDGQNEATEESSKQKDAPASPHLRGKREHPTEVISKPAPQQGPRYQRKIFLLLLSLAVFNGYTYSMKLQKQADKQPNLVKNKARTSGEKNTVAPGDEVSRSAAIARSMKASKSGKTGKSSAESKGADSSETPLAAQKKQHWKLGINYPSHTISGSMLTNGAILESLQLLLTLAPPRELTPLEHVRGIKKPPWIRKVKVIQARIFHALDGSFLVVGRGKATVEHKGNTDLVFCNLELEGTIDLKQGVISGTLKFFNNRYIAKQTDVLKIQFVKGEYPFFFAKPFSISLNNKPIPAKQPALETEIDTKPASEQEPKTTTPSEAATGKAPPAIPDGIVIIEDTH